MSKLLFLSIFFVFMGLHARAQQKYWVFFKDKQGVTFDPYRYFDQQAIERRINAHLPLFDSTDFPVKDTYMSAVAALADSMGSTSRWLNATGVWCCSQAAMRIGQLPFVRAVEPMHSIPVQAEANGSKKDTVADELVRYQIDRLGGQAFRQRHINGKGVRIAILDIGFANVNRHPAFAHLMDNKQIIKTYDFVRNKEDVYYTGFHGTMVLSCIAGKYDTAYTGMAPEAEFLLAKTERLLTEWKEEEDNWVAAAEWADKNGAKIISSSLGYSDQRYFYKEMNGHYSYIARGATMAAHKGILVVNAAGNEATNHWRYLVTPGDADSVLTVGGTDPYTNIHIEFSSYGPSAAYTTKPNVVAPGYVWTATPKKYAAEYGTSFSTPLISGFAACVWQMHPEWTNMQVFQKLEESGNLYPYYDYAHGYGIPQASFFVNGKANQPAKPTFYVKEKDDTFHVSLADSYKTTLDTGRLPKDHRYMFFHFADSKGHISKYFVVKVSQMNVFDIPKGRIPAGEHISMHFDGYTEEIKP